MTELDRKESVAGTVKYTRYIIDVWIPNKNSLSSFSLIRRQCISPWGRWFEKTEGESTVNLLAHCQQITIQYIYTCAP